MIQLYMKVAKRVVGDHAALGHLGQVLPHHDYPGGDITSTQVVGRRQRLSYRPKGYFYTCSEGRNDVTFEYTTDHDMSLNETISCSACFDRGRIMHANSSGYLPHPFIIRAPDRNQGTRLTKLPPPSILLSESAARPGHPRRGKYQRRPGQTRQ